MFQPTWPQIIHVKYYKTKCILKRDLLLSLDALIYIGYNGIRSYSSFFAIQQTNNTASPVVATGETTTDSSDTSTDTTTDPSAESTA